MSEAITFKNVTQKGEPSEYQVFLNGDHIGNVRKSRMNAVGSMRYRTFNNRSDHGVGHWAWDADLAPENEYPTRREAVQDMVAAWRRKQRLTAHDAEGIS